MRGSNVNAAATNGTVSLTAKGGTSEESETAAWRVTMTGEAASQGQQEQQQPSGSASPPTSPLATHTPPPGDDVLGTPLQARVDHQHLTASAVQMSTPELIIRSVQPLPAKVATDLNAFSVKQQKMRTGTYQPTDRSALPCQRPINPTP